MTMAGQDDSIIWLGSIAAHEQPGSPDIDGDNSGLVVVRTYEGPYDVLRGAVPKINSVMADIDEKPTVRHYKLTKLEGGIGRLVITARKEYGNSGIDAGEGDELSTYEVDNQQLEKPLLSHPRYVAAGVNTEDANGNSVAGFVSMYMNAATSAERKTVRDDVAKSGCPAAAKNLFPEIIGKLMLGRDSYIIPAPVLRITTPSVNRPGTTTVGKKVDPSFPGKPAGYEWLGTADRSIRRGKSGTWERVQEFTGADEWDPQLYGGES